jgi:hypothetical protein
MSGLMEYRVRSVVPPEEIEDKVGKVLTEEDFNLLVTRDAVVRKPNGQPLLIYRRGVIPPELRESTWPILSELRKTKTANRGYAGGSKRVEIASGKRSEAKRVASALVGSFERQGPRKYCRLTAWTGQETRKYKILWPLLEFISGRLAEDVPDRYAAQLAAVRATHPDWIIPGTVFSTVTVNNTYETGVHKDAGDLAEGFSTLACFRRGDYSGGHLVFPEFRVAVDMQDGDLLLMDAHEWHGNVFLDPPPLYTINGTRQDRDPETGQPPYERISVVSYFRTKMATCGSLDDENERRLVAEEQRMSARVGL